MAFYDGPPIAHDNLSLDKPRPSELTKSLRTADLNDEQKGWFERAEHDDACLFFAVFWDHVLIGQFFLHDADWSKREALVGYHIFQAGERGRGSGTAALTLLCDYAAGELGLRRLVAITGIDNQASRRIASKSGFREIDPAREGTHLVVYQRLSP